MPLVPTLGAIEARAVGLARPRKVNHGSDLQQIYTTCLPSKALDRAVAST
jgi:hypothetical protein